MYEATLEWLAADGAPNGLVVLALLTRPSTWTGAVVRLAKDRLGIDVEDLEADGE